MGRFRAVVALGPPGAGKGTACRRVAESEPWLCYLATGDLVREAQAGGDEFSAKITAALKAGGRIPEEDMVRLLEEGIYSRIDSGVYDPFSQVLLGDGFPRSVEQSDMINEFLDIKEVLLFENVSIDALTTRCLNRGILEKRTDDNPDAIANRQSDYLATGAPVIDVLAGRTVPVHRIAAGRSPDEVYSEVRAHLRARKDAYTR